MRVAAFVDAGSLWDYQGPTSYALTGEVNTPGCIRGTSSSSGTCAGLQYDDTNLVRTLGRCRPDLAVSVRSAALRLRRADHKGQVRPGAGVQVWRRNDVLSVITACTATDGMTQPQFL